MIEITEEWKYFYKIDYKNKNPVTTNLLYTPKISPNGNVLCMIFDETHEYQSESTQLTKDLVDFFFEREVKYLSIFQGKDWAPTILDINKEARTVTIEFSNQSLNHIVTDPNRSLDNECPTWKEQIWNIIKDIDNLGYYKLALYPHCFFLKDGVIKIIDFYACIEKEYPFIEKNKIAGIIGDFSIGRFHDSTEGELINFQTFFKITMTSFLSTTWGEDNPFPEYYKRLGYD